MTKTFLHSSHSISNRHRAIWILDRNKKIGLEPIIEGAKHHKLRQRLQSDFVFSYHEFKKHLHCFDNHVIEVLKAL